MKTAIQTLVLAAIAGFSLTAVRADSSAPRNGATPATQPAGPLLFEGKRPDEWKSYQELHAYMLDRFIKSEGFGLRRAIRIEDLPGYRKLYADGTRYVVGRMQLISLNSGKDPFCYVTTGDDVLKNQIKTARHRPLDETDLAALKEIESGKEAVLAGEGKGRELVGAVRAVGACVKCHDVPDGTLLGAFRYPLYEATERKSK